MLLAGALVVVLLMAAGLWWVLRPGEDPETAACPYPVVSGVTSARPSGDNRATIAAPSSGAVTVTETGFTQITNQGEVSIGAVVENTSSQVAYQTRGIFGAFEADGSYALGEAERFNYFFEIPIIRPGERAVIGTYAFLDRASFNRTGNWIHVAQASLQLVQTQWISAADTGTFPAIIARLNTEKPPLAQDGRVTIYLAADSDVCRKLGSRGMGIVFRDAGGAVVGGSYYPVRDPEFCASGGFTATAQVFDSKLPDADLARTDLSAYCDLTPSSDLPPGPTQPVN
ncbi:hypothetical protein [Plantactinospora sp. KLBMP9567]|uniref:hypothetical protein n=1 Tax=Plantactinospora sp. KLBMP9567 TaxID=3085900 RepID=UPI0029828713|nr:hypothetical protein [Plantactinospora sp. KLBMP9567]MDW5326431.1 hypothetical protein [Plantactinospora sp. KLBMP9567]